MRDMKYPARASRRRFIKSAAGITAAAPLGLLLSRLAEAAPTERNEPIPPLDENKLSLAEGLSYRPFSVMGQRMDDGLAVPELHDGMACFAGDNGHTLLVRNHEVYVKESSPRPELAYDPKCRGGTVTIELDAELNLVRHHLSLTGTRKNCSGGATPWGTWLSCEEEFGAAAERHGYVFEVDPRAKTLTKGEPLRAMGRFEHEAAGVDPETGVVYLTEDKGDSAFYRFIPKEPGRLAAGGRLQGF